MAFCLTAHEILLFSDFPAIAGLDNPALGKIPEKEEELGLREPPEPVDYHLADLLQQLTLVTNSNPTERVPVKQGKPRAPRETPLSGALMSLCSVTAPFFPCRGGRRPSLHPHILG